MFLWSLIGLATSCWWVLRLYVPEFRAPRFPACGKCSYCVAGVAALRCPECGSDLLRVGIAVSPIRRPSVRTLVLAEVGVLLLAVLLTAQLADLISGLTTVTTIQSGASGSVQVWDTSAAGVESLTLERRAIDTTHPAVPNLVRVTLRNKGSEGSLDIAPLRGTIKVIDPLGEREQLQKAFASEDIGLLYAAAGLPEEEGRGASAQTLGNAVLVCVQGGDPIPGLVRGGFSPPGSVNRPTLTPIVTTVGARGGASLGETLAIGICTAGLGCLLIYRRWRRLVQEENS